MAQSVQTSIHELEKLSDEQVGAHFKEYLRENEHAGWEGFEDEMNTIRALLQDFSFYTTFYVPKKNSPNDDAIFLRGTEED